MRQASFETFWQQRAASVQNGNSAHGVPMVHYNDHNSTYNDDGAWSDICPYSMTIDLSK